MSIKVTVNCPLLISLLAVFFLSGCDKNTLVEPKQGDLFPLLALEELARNSNSPINLTNKTLLINFWATWCTACRKEMPELQQLSDTLDADKFMLIGVSVDEDKYLMQEFLLQQQISFANYHDANQYLAGDILAVSAYPETFLVSPQGIIIKRIIGEQLWNSESMHTLLETIHKGQKIPQNGGVF
jgi:thiol-disulfide isomerase/thioredoxin